MNEHLEANTNPADAIAAKAEAFVRAVVFGCERDSRINAHAPSNELVQELQARARAAGVLTPHILEDGSHLTHRDTALVLIKPGLSPLGPLACNTMAPDDGNMYLVGKSELPSRKRNSWNRWYPAAPTRLSS